MLCLFRVGGKKSKVAEGGVGRNVAARMEKPSTERREFKRISPVLNYVSLRLTGEGFEWLTFAAVEF